MIICFWLGFCLEPTRQATLEGTNLAKLEIITGGGYALDGSDFQQ